jgi:hypothetical protein
MTDGGNTQLMLQQVEMAGEADAYDTYRHLMKTSPGCRKKYWWPLQANRKDSTML